MYLLNNFSIRLPSVSFPYDIYYYRFNEFSYWLTPIFFVIVYSSFYTHFNIFLLSLNRLTAVWKFSTYESVSFLDPLGVLNNCIFSYGNELLHTCWVLVFAYRFCIAFRSWPVRKNTNRFKFKISHLLWSLTKRHGLCG